MARGGEQSFLKLITSANRNKCGIRTIGLVKTTPIYLCSLAPCKDPNLNNNGTELARAYLTNSGSKVTQTYATSTSSNEGAPTHASKQKHKAN